MNQPKSDSLEGKEITLEFKPPSVSPDFETFHKINIPLPISIISSEGDESKLKVNLYDGNPVTLPAEKEEIFGHTVLERLTNESAKRTQILSGWDLMSLTLPLDVFNRIQNIDGHPLCTPVQRASLLAMHNDKASVKTESDTGDNIKINSYDEESFDHLFHSIHIIIHKKVEQALKKGYFPFNETLEADVNLKLRPAGQPDPPPPISDKQLGNVLDRTKYPEPFDGDEVEFTVAPKRVKLKLSEDPYVLPTSEEINRKPTTDPPPLSEDDPSRRDLEAVRDSWKKQHGEGDPAGDSGDPDDETEKPKK